MLLRIKKNPSPKIIVMMASLLLFLLVVLLLPAATLASSALQDPVVPTVTREKNAQSAAIDTAAAKSTTTTTSPSKSHRTTTTKRLTEVTMSPNLRRMEYAVRGSIVIAADKINEDLQKAKNEQRTKYPFDKIVYTNIGNPQSVGQKPLTWPRQVMALVDLPNEVGIDHPDASKLFPKDAIARARQIKEEALGGHGSGAYSHSKGAKLFRDDVCSFLKERDGVEVPTDPEDIFLSNGASAAIVSFL